MSTVDSRIIELENQLKSLKVKYSTENEKLKKTLKESQRKNERMENVLKKVRAKVKKVERMNKKLSLDNESILSENKELKWKMGISKIVEHKLEVKMGKLKKVNVNIIEESGLLRKEKDELEKRLIGEVEQCKFEKVEARKKIETMEEGIKQLKNILKDKTAEIVQKNEELIKNKKVLNETIYEKNTIKKNLSDIIVELRTTEKKFYECQLQTDLLLKQIKKKKFRLFLCM